MVLSNDFVRSRLESLRALKEDRNRRRNASSVQKESYLPLSFQHLFDDATQWAKEKQSAYVEQTKLPLLFESYVTSQFDTVASEGDKKVANIKRDIGNCSPSPTPRQWQMLDTFMQVSAPWYYGDEWLLNQDDILQRNGWQKYDGIMAVQLERKAGKSTMLSFSCLGDLLNMPNSKIALISRTQPQAQIILFLVIDLLRRHPRREEFKIKYNKTQLVLATGSEERILTAYSGDPNVSRGWGEWKGPPSQAGTLLFKLAFELRASPRFAVLLLF